MYYLFDMHGVIRGQTSERSLVVPLKEAIEYIMLCDISVFVRNEQGKYTFVA